MINNHNFLGYYKPGYRGGLPLSNGIHSFENLGVSCSLLLKCTHTHTLTVVYGWGHFKDTGDRQLILGAGLWINNSTQRLDISLTQHHLKIQGQKYWWPHLADNLSTWNSGPSGPGPIYVHNLQMMLLNTISIALWIYKHLFL